MSKKPFPRIITGAVISTIAVAAFLTFTRGEAPQTDTASTLLPSVSDTAGPIVEGSTPTPSSSASADATERAAQNAGSTTQTPVKTPIKSGSTTTSPPKDPDPTQPPPSPTPSPKPCGLLTAILGGCK